MPVRICCKDYGALAVELGWLRAQRDQDDCSAKSASRAAALTGGHRVGVIRIGGLENRNVPTGQAVLAYSCSRDSP